MSTPRFPIAGHNSKQQGNSSKLNMFAMSLVAVAASAGLLLSPVCSHASQDNYLPDIRLIDQNSQAVSLSSLRGRPVLVGFIHTMCKGVCQMMTANMQSVASALPPSISANVTMLLITTDPADDQPPQLVAYAKQQNLSGKEWVLVTGHEDSIKRVMRLYGVKHEDSDDAMMHVMKLFLVAPNGTLAHVYPGMKLSPRAVASDIQAVSQHPPAHATNG